jgi:signal transduction histidine kinase
MSRSEAHPSYDRSVPANRGCATASAALENKITQLQGEVARLQSALSEQTVRYVAERDTERESIARELHDKLGQYLTVMDLELGAIGANVEVTEQLREKLQMLRRLTADAQDEMAIIAWQIRPASLHSFDLENACKLLASEWSDRSNLLFELHISLGTRTLPATVKTTLYRVLQEALTNVAKHANARRVGIILRASAHEVVLVVEDDGDGFVLNQDKNMSVSLGLTGVRERLALVCGSLEIETSPGRGTTVLASVPL